MLEGKTILVTGSSRPNGIGFATAKLIKQYGGTPILHSRTDNDDIKSCANKLGCEYIVCDITDEQAVYGEIDRLFAKEIHIDGLANVAGVVTATGTRATFLETTMEEWRGVFDVNVMGSVYFMKKLIPHMQEHGGGAIVNIASVRAHQQGTVSGRVAYSASKAALINLTQTVAREVGPLIRVNSISPGATDTDIAKTWSEDMRAANEKVPLGRLGKPTDIGEVICFLLSDKAAFITGSDYPVDGGYLLGK